MTDFKRWLNSRPIDFNGTEMCIELKFMVADGDSAKTTEAWTSSLRDYCETNRTEEEFWEWTYEHGESMVVIKPAES
jgi:hypothetical protein